MYLGTGAADGDDEEPSVCAICKRPDPDYSHMCGAHYHKDCLEQYRKFIGSSDMICPHCLEKISFDEKRTEAVEFVEEAHAPMELLAQQYLDLSNEYYLELVNNDMYYVRAYVTNMDPESGIWHMYPITINYTNYPDRPRMMIPEDVLTDALDLTETIDLLRNWDADNPPRIVDVVKTIEAAITDKNRLFEELDELEHEEGGWREGRRRFAFEFPTYGGRTIRFALGLQQYPDAPEVIIEGICFEKGFDILRGWKRRRSRLLDVVHEIKGCMMRHHRRTFEAEVLRFYFDVEEDRDLLVTLVDPFTAASLVLKVTFPDEHPVEPVLIDVDQYDGVPTEALERVFRIIGSRREKWSPTVYAVDVILEIRDELFGHVARRCPVCGAPDCPVCGADLDEGCRVECPNCEHPLHEHCSSGRESCPYCIAPLRSEIYEVEPSE